MPKQDQGEIERMAMRLRELAASMDPNSVEFAQYQAAASMIEILLMLEP